jgi:hypothetical protein
MLFQQGRRTAQGWYENVSLPGDNADQRKNGSNGQGQPEHQEGAAYARSNGSSATGTATKVPRVKVQGVKVQGAKVQGVRSPVTLIPPHTNGTQVSPTEVSVAIHPRPILTALQPTLNAFTPPQSTAEELPRLQPGEVLRGNLWGKYTIGHCLQDEGRKRLYEATQFSSSELVWIQEYLMPEAEFSDKQVATRQEAFSRFVDLNLKLGNGPDFRIVKLKDFGQDTRRCFLITRPIYDSLPLSYYLEQHGVMSPLQVRSVLQQVLETLRFLHSAYRVRWSVDKSERGLYHGNLSLDSLRIRLSQAQGSRGEQQFFIYVTNFALWEHLFNPDSAAIATSNSSLGSISRDLKALGRVAFQLLVGGVLKPDSREPLNPKHDADWFPNRDYELKQFILKLLELNPPSFRGAEAALQVLRELPESDGAPLPELLPTPAQPDELAIEAEAEPELDHNLIWLWLIVALGALGLLAGVFWFTTVFLPNSRIIPVAKLPRENCCMNDVSVPTNTLKYAVESGASWEYAMDHSLDGLTRSPGSHAPLETVLERRRSGLRLELFVPEPQILDVSSPDNLVAEPLSVPDESREDSTLQPSIESIHSTLTRTKIFDLLNAGQIDFALMQGDADLPPGLKSDVVAYDALVVLVAFTDASQGPSAAKLIGEEITLEQLRQIYTGQLQTLNGYRIKAYFPFGAQLAASSREEATIDLMRQILFKENPEAQQQFNTFRETARFAALQESRSAAVESNSSSTLYYNLFERIFQGFEQQDLSRLQDINISVGFERLSTAFEQCSVYPLAIANGQQTTQLLVQAYNRPIDPTTDLCNDKGSYWPNVQALAAPSNGSAQYPLAFPLTVVYRENSEAGAKVAELLKTAEGQYLLSQVGLVPTLPIPELTRYTRQAMEEAQ